MCEDPSSAVHADGRSHVALVLTSCTGVLTDGVVLGTAAQLLPLVCLQNGVENERVAQRYFDRVVAACVWVPSQLVEPGVLVLPGTPYAGAVDVGCYPSGVDDVSQQLSSDLADGGIVSRVNDQTMRLKYYKLLANLRNVLTALFPPHEDVTEVAVATQREGRAVFAAAGIDMTDLETELARVEPLTRLGRVDGFEYLGNSTAQSLASGAGSVETDYLNGEVALLGCLYDVPAPINRALQRLANRAAQVRAAPRSLSINDLKQELRDNSAKT